MSTNNIVIQISQTGAQTVTVNLAGIGNAAQKSSGQVDIMQRALALLGAALAIDKVKQWADAWNQAAGLINVATKSTEEQAAVMEKLFNVAQSTRTSFNDLVSLYSKAARAGSDLGASQNQVIEFAQGVAKALVIQHTSADQASGSLLQLGQLLGTGKVRAQEFNSVNENLTVVLKTVAQNIDGAGGSVAKLRAIMAQGGLTSKQFFDAFLKGQAGLNDDFDKSSKTIAQAFVVVNNAVEKYVGQLDKMVGSSATLNTIAVALAKNMDTLATSVLAVGAAVAVAFAPAAIEAFYAAVVRLFVLINTNPFIALASAVAAAVTYFGILGDKLNAGIDGITTYKDLFNAFRDTVVLAFSGLGDTIGSVFSKITGVTLPTFFSDTNKGFTGILQAVARTFDAIDGLIIAAFIFVGREWTGLPDVFKNIFERVYNAVATGIEGVVNVVINGINTLRSTIGNTNILAPLQIERLNVDPQVFQNYGASLADSLKAGFDAQGQFLEKSLDSIFDKAVDYAKTRTAAEAQQALNVKIPDLNAPIGTPTKIVDLEAQKKAASELRSLLDTVKPSIGAVLDLSKAQSSLNDAVKAGLIDRALANNYLQLAKDHYEDIINPVGVFVRTLQQETSALGLNAEARATDQEVQEDVNTLHEKGINLGLREIESLREQIQAKNDYNRQVQQEDSLLAATVGKREQYIDQLDAINKLMTSPKGLSFNQQDASEQLLNTGDNATLLAGTKNFVDGTIAQYQRMYEEIGILRNKGSIDQQTADQLYIQQTNLLTQKLIEAKVQAAQVRLDLGTSDWVDPVLVGLNRLQNGFTTLTSGVTNIMGDFFTSLEDGFADSIGKAVVESDNLGDALRNVAKQVEEQLISALIKLGIQWVAQTVLKNTLSASSAAATTATSVAAGAATATAWAPAAAAVSLATFGANSIPAVEGMAAGYSFSEAMALLAGFQGGGYTGNDAVDQVAGVVHGQEFVVNADGTRKNRALLEAINAGQNVVMQSGSTRGSGGSGPLTISVQNNGTPQTYEAKQLSVNEVRLIAEDAVARKAPDTVASSLGNPNSKFSKAMTTHTLSQRRRSA